MYMDSAEDECSMFCFANAYVISIENRKKIQKNVALSYLVPALKP